MNKILIPSLICAALLTACGGDSDSNSTQNQGAENNNSNNGQLPGPAETRVNVSGSSNFDQSSQLTLAVAMTDLKGEEAVYYKASGDALDKNQIKVTPSHAVLYPTNGKLTLKVDIEDKGLEKNQPVTFSITTADGTDYSVSRELEIK